MEERLGIDIALWRHLVEGEVLLEHLPNALSENPADLFAPLALLRRVVPRVARDDKEEVHVAMRDKQGVAVEEAILEVP